MFNNREINKQIAEKTMEILKTGSYQAEGQTVSIQEELDRAIKGSILYSPTSLENLTFENHSSLHFSLIEVNNETSLKAARRLKEEGFEKVAVLNFASAKNPGGGFLNGSMAQEESLAISSGLYPTITQMTEMYNFNKRTNTGLYSNYMIYSPNVPVFRNDNLSLNPNPFLCSFITAPAVNAEIVRERERHNANKISSTMRYRIEKILTIALAHKQEAIVLGAYGCGVFKNNPRDVATYFKECLLQNPRFKNQFKKVTFAILNEELVRTFKTILK